MVRSFLALATFLLACQTHAHASAFAESDVLLFDLKFGLASRSQSVTTGVPSDFCLPQIGDGDCGKSDIDDNWSFPTTKGPTPLDKDLRIAGFGNAEAFSPPASLSWYIEGVGGFFSFTNNSPDPVDVDVLWNIGYLLTTEGTASSAGVNAIYSEKDVTSGETLIKPTLWPGLKPPSVKNGQDLEAAQSGSFVVSIPADSTTRLHIEVTMSAFAANISTPEPSNVLLSGSGLIALLGLAWWGRRLRLATASASISSVSRHHRGQSQTEHRH